MRSIAACGWLPLVLACSFDATGLGESPGSAVGTTAMTTTGTGEPPGLTSTGTPTTTSGSSGTDGVSGDSTTGAVDPTTGLPDLTTGPDPTTTTTIDLTTTTDTTTTGDDTTTTSDDTTGEPDQTTGPDPCEMVTKVIVPAVDASVADPMGKYMSAQVQEGTVVYSKVKDMGTADFPVTLACAGEVAVWVRVLDQNPGINDYDPDSLYLRVDGGEEKTWFYGCQTMGMGAGYRWLRVRTGVQGAPCDEAVLLTPNLSASTHNFMFRNREATNNAMHVAAIARMLVTTDLNYVPTNED